MKNIKASLANILTLFNLSLGVLAILFAVLDQNSVYQNTKEDLNTLFYASLLIMIAALLDRLDGKIARMLNTASDFGKELDSLSDLVSFGVAPIVIAWKIAFLHFGIGGYILAVLFPIAGAYRLARYNTTPFEDSFKGVPITIAGAFLTLDNIYNIFAMINNKYSSIHTVISAMAVIVLSFLMVSNIKIKKV